MKIDIKKNRKMTKVIIVSAPSGSGKSTIVNEVLKDPSFNLSFSISTTSRPARGAEKNGVEYYFISKETFKEQITQNKFIEWEEVYEGSFYGTYKSEVERLSAEGKHIIFDIDVKGAKNLKQYFGQNALSIFIKPPSLEILEQRLIARGTDSLEKIKTRLQRASFEMTQAEFFDKVITNDDLQMAMNEFKQDVLDFLK